MAYSLKLSAYPNPFNPSTNFEYEITRQSNIELRIFDLLGREVWSLKKDNMSVGKHSVEWNGVGSNGRELASGVYLLNFNSNIHYKTIKLVLLR
jgi:flagellar hook assembly protein FlgD